METWDIFLTDQLEVRRGLSTAEVHAAVARGEIRDDDLIRPAGSADPWAPIVDRLPPATSVEPAAPAAITQPPSPPQTPHPPVPPVFVEPAAADLDVPSIPTVSASSNAPITGVEAGTTEFFGEILGLKTPKESQTGTTGEKVSKVPREPEATEKSADIGKSFSEAPSSPVVPPQPPERPVALFADEDEDELVEAEDDDDDFPSVEMLEKADERRSPQDSRPGDLGGRLSHVRSVDHTHDHSDGYTDDPLPAGLRAELGRDDLRAESETVVLGIGGALSPATEWDHSTKAEIADMALGEHGGEDEDDLSLTRGGTEKVEELDLAAMVDVAMQLVLFFLVTGLTVMFKTMEVPKPNPDKPAGGVSQGQGRTLDDLMHDYILVEMDAEGSIKVDQEPVAANFDALVERLRTARESSGGRNTMLLNVDYNTPHRDAVMAYDAANEIGLSVAVGQPSQESSGAPPPAPAAPKGGM